MSEICACAAAVGVSDPGHHAGTSDVQDAVRGQEAPADPVDPVLARQPGDTSERGYDSAEPHFRGISDRHGNLMVLMTHNTDISDAWEREGEDPRYFYQFSPRGYAVGINVIMYAMTH